MKRLGMRKRIILYVCLLIVVAAGCFAQFGKGADTMMRGTSSYAMSRQAAGHRGIIPNALGNGQWISSDDMASHASFDDRRAIYMHRSSLSLLLRDRMLAGLAALFAMLSAGLFHDSSCQTRGLRRMLLFRQAADGEKDRAYIPGWEFT